MIWNDLKFMAVLLCVVLAGAGAIVALTVLGVYTIDRPSCYAQWRDSGHKVRWDIWGGCRISTDGGQTWIPSDNYVVNTERE